MSSSNWDKRIQKYLFFYRDGFFELPYFSDSPRAMINSLKNTPESTHKLSEQAITSNNLFCEGVVRYREIEEGLWLLATNIDIKENIVAKALYQETGANNHYVLSFSVFEYVFSSNTDFTDKPIVKSTCWTFYKPKTQVSTYFYKGTTGRFCNFIFTKQWVENNAGFQKLPKENGIQQFMKSGIGFMNWLDVVPNSHEIFKEIWKILEIDQQQPFEIINLKEQTVNLISNFFTAVFNEKRLQKYVPLNNKDYPNIAKAEKTILQNLASPFIGIEKIANEVNLSPTKLKSNFKSVFGLSLLQYHKEKNMLLAMQLMQNSSMQIKNIATAIGYDSSSKFTVSFKKRFGILPSEIRNK